MASFPRLLAAISLLLHLVAADQVAVNSAAWAAGELGAAPTQSFLSSNLTPPLFNELVAPTAEASSNYTFLSYRGSATKAAPVIMDINGSLVWSGAAQGYGDSMDLKVQMLNDEPVLTFFEGSFYSGGYGYGHVSCALLLDREDGRTALRRRPTETIAELTSFRLQWNILSTNYSLIGTVQSLNETADTSDFHEMLISSNNTALVESWRTTQADLSAVSGYSEGTSWVYDCVL